MARTTFTARFTSRCPICEGVLGVGQHAVMTDEGAAHVTCDEDDEAGPVHPVCAVCWLTHPEGQCDRG